MPSGAAVTSAVMVLSEGLRQESGPDLGALARRIVIANRRPCQAS